MRQRNLIGLSLNVNLINSLFEKDYDDRFAVNFKLDKVEDKLKDNFDSIDS